MSLIDLPIEVLEHIVRFTLPEGFEDAALTCKKLYSLCIPFIEKHNRLRSRFRHFSYYENTSEWVHTIRTAFDVITRIAVEPIVARYIQHADFAKDSRFTRGRPRELLADVHSDGAVLKLFAHSAYLEKAGLDWQKFYDEVEKDLESIRYSQYAAAFLLTLLPNVKTIILPQQWVPSPATGKLIDVIAHEGNQSNPSEDWPSLVQLTAFTPYVSVVDSDWFDLEWVKSFLALPNLQTFCGTSCVAVGDNGPRSITSNPSLNSFGKALTSIDFTACCIDHVGITWFLQHIRDLKTFRYSHSTKIHYNTLEWSIGKFLTAIERKISGDQLEELSVTIRDARTPLVYDKAPSMQGFQGLRRLELSLEALVADAAAIAEYRSSINHSPLNDEASLLDTIIPAPVSLLSLISDGSEHHVKILGAMFRHLAIWKSSSRSPALEKIFLSSPYNPGKLYMDQCNLLLEEAERAGVTLHLKQTSSPQRILWDEEG